MTSSERKIINCLWGTKEKTHIRLVAQKANLSSDYARLLCRSLARSGHIKFENDIAHLLKKGRGRFENNSSSAEKPQAVAANVTLLTDEPAISATVDQEDEEKGHDQDGDGDEDESDGQPASDDAELDKALADLNPLPKKDESEEEKGNPEEPKDETGSEPPEKEEEKTEEIIKEPKEEISADKKEDTLAETEEKEKMGKPDEVEEMSEPKEPETPNQSADADATGQETEEVKAKETATESEAKAATDAFDNKEKEKAENPEKVALKEEPVKPSGGFGASLKRVVNWFAEKK